NGGSNGAATLAVSGGTPGYTYSWSPSGGTGVSISGRTAGTYTCTITDANGCTQTQTVSITEPTVIASSVSSQTNISCNGGNDGAATLAVSGGTPSYTYLWSPSGGTGVSITGQAAGTYTCTITDANGCTQTQTVSITEPTAIVVSTSTQTDVSCNGQSDGIAAVAVTGGTGTYAYLWSPSGGNAATASGLTAGTYTCTVTDANSCSQMHTVTITEPAAIDVLVTTSANTLTANQSGASYQWIDCQNGNAPIANEINQSFLPTLNGNYAVIVTVGGCSDTSLCMSFITGIATSELLLGAVYPNPSEGEITIQIAQPESVSSIAVFNALGQLIMTVKPTGTQTIVQLPETPGVYLISINADRETMQVRVIRK
ncbi:MAG: T9SS type A sorting domain-containing protein, partial [Bacteroidia bacterium]